MNLPADAAPTESLQWGHGREAMDGMGAGDYAVRLGELQWGHGREAMDGARQRSPTSSLHNFNGAMAVRPWMDLSTRGPRPCPWDFNGAMAVRPWMVGCGGPGVFGPAQLQWGHGREAMDGLQVID